MKFKGDKPLTVNYADKTAGGTVPSGGGSGGYGGSGGGTDAQSLLNSALGGALPGGYGAGSDGSGGGGGNIQPPGKCSCSGVVVY